MMTAAIQAHLTTAAIVGTGLVGGVLFAFSSFVMPGLRDAGTEAGMTSMNALNVTAERPPFMIPFFGTLLVCLVLGAAAFSALDTKAGVLRLVGAGLYLLVIVVTAVYHVPHNNALGLLDPQAASSVHEWSSYVSGWTVWNHVRTVFALSATVCFAIAQRVA
jgi:uncharacterized membrane protein